MSFRKVIVEFQCSVRIVPCFREGLLCREVEMASHQSIAIRHTRVSYGVVWILLYCFPKIGYCLLEVFLVPPAPMVSSSEFENIGSNLLSCLPLCTSSQMFLRLPSDRGSTKGC